MENTTHLILNFTDTYPEAQESLTACFPESDVIRLNFRDISGTDLYCDDEARAEILSRIGAYPLRGVHFLDSGNYHYMTRLFTSRLDRDYALLFYDHHTDMQPASFDLLSCGSWAKECLEQDPHLKKLICVGPPAESMALIPEELARDPRLACLDETTFLADPGIVAKALPPELPLYLSIDKDVLRKSDAITNWDQGNVSLDFLCEHLVSLLRGRDVLGIDICGLTPVMDLGFTASSQSLQLESDRILLKALSL